jgi:hypothetical protein
MAQVPDVEPVVIVTVDDPYSYTHLCGSTADGIRCQGGICLINCSNNNELYSFHSGGVNALFYRRLGAFPQGEHGPAHRGQPDHAGGG